MENRNIFIIGGAVAAAVILGVILFFVFGNGTEEENAEPNQSVIDQPIQTPDTADTNVDESNIPTFDIVRVERDGAAVIAGRAAPGSIVSLLRGDTTIATAKADDSGEWVIVLDEPLKSGEFELSLKVTTPDGIEAFSTQKVAISVPSQPNQKALVVLSEPGKASKVLQGPGVAADAGQLVLEVVDYDEKGNVIFSGRGTPNATIRIYVNDSPVGDAITDSNGAWELRPVTVIEPGQYTLRVDELGEGNIVVARVEVPFERGEPEEVVRQLANGKVVIQPGNNLWNIAKQIYGSGYRYTVIYAANSDQIRDPDLIYPGQILNAPDR
ncbi:MAG: LysM peptidoglycan-binding domain-containing protein [Parvibaculaceae bacterium]|nr:LysM peptidoglycan-binding domain-containing protein [Parvibaculaceae bacterium]